MHYKGHLITKKIPTNDEISDILEKYRETYGEKIKDFEWDYYIIGGRYGGELKIKFNPCENEDNYYAFHDRNRKYFISNIIDIIKEKINKYYDELDYLMYMGLNDNILYVDGAYYKDIIDFDITNCFLVINENNIYVREKWDGDNWVENNNFDNEVKNIALNDKFITIIDFHD